MSFGGSSRPKHEREEKKEPELRVAERERERERQREGEREGEGEREIMVATSLYLPHGHTIGRELATAYNPFFANNNNNNRGNLRCLQWCVLFANASSFLNRTHNKNTKMTHTAPSLAKRQLTAMGG